MKLIAVSVLIVLCVLLEMNSLATRDAQIFKDESVSLERELADDRLLEFGHGRTKFVDEEDLFKGSPAIVEEVHNRLD